MSWWGGANDLFVPADDILIVTTLVVREVGVALGVSMPTMPVCGSIGNPSVVVKGRTGMLPNGYGTNPENLCPASSPMAEPNCMADQVRLPSRSGFPMD